MTATMRQLYRELANRKARGEADEQMADFLDITLEALEKIARGEKRETVDGEEYVIPMSGHEACRIANNAISALAQRQTGGRE